MTQWVDVATGGIVAGGIIGILHALRPFFLGLFRRIPAPGLEAIKVYPPRIQDAINEVTMQRIMDYMKRQEDSNHDTAQVLGEMRDILLYLKTKLNGWIPSGWTPK